LLYWILKYVILGPLVWLRTRPRVRGRAHLPRRGPLIVAANHAAEIDSLVLGTVLPRRICFVAKVEYFAPAAARSRLYASLCRATGQIPVDRTGGTRAAGALLAARAILDRGRVWAIYPEGTRCTDGRVHRGHTGVMRVALATGAPVVPVGLHGTDQRGRVTVRIGTPLDLSAYHDEPADWRAATDALMRALAELSGMEYVDSYAPRRDAS
jgi:1-acyl-sn-glycerol-3-phosphate acyltransferase